MYITEICMEKQYKSSIIKNHKITKKSQSGIKGGHLDFSHITKL